MNCSQDTFPWPCLFFGSRGVIKIEQLPEKPQIQYVDPFFTEEPDQLEVFKHDMRKNVQNIAWKYYSGHFGYILQCIHRQTLRIFYHFKRLHGKDIAFRHPLARPSNTIFEFWRSHHVGDFCTTSFYESV